MMNLYNTRSNTYACNQCDKTFRNNSDLKLHEKWHLFKFECSLSGCKERFGRFIDLQRHETTHNGALGEEQLEILEDAFKVTAVPTDEQFKELVFATGMLEDNIKFWFKAKREHDNKVTVKDELVIKEEVMDQEPSTELTNDNNLSPGMVSSEFSEQIMDHSSGSQEDFVLSDSELNDDINNVPSETVDKAKRYDLMKLNYENLKAEIDQLKLKYILEDSDDEDDTDVLPSGWKCDKLTSQFESPEGIILQGREQALKFMRFASNKYTKEDIEKIDNFGEPLVCKRDNKAQPSADLGDSRISNAAPQMDHGVDLNKQNNYKDQPIKRNNALKITSSIDLTDGDNDVVPNNDNGNIDATNVESGQLTDEQLEILNDAYEVAPNPSDEQYDELVFGTGLDESRIKEWFAEKRNESSTNVIQEVTRESTSELTIHYGDIAINTEQLEILEDAFTVSSELSDEQYDELVFATGLEEKAIKDWFETKKKVQTDLHGAVVLDNESVTISSTNSEVDVTTSEEDNAFQEINIPATIENPVNKWENILEEEQIEILEDAYKVAPFPTDEQFDELIVATGLDKVFLKKWFLSKNKEQNNSNDSETDFSPSLPMDLSNASLRSSCVTDGWVEDVGILPSGWLIKKHHLAGRTEEWQYLSPDDTRFNSTTEMLSHLRDKMSSEEKYSSIFRTAKNSLEMLKKSWIKDETIPSGWFIKYSTEKDGKNTFMAPDNRRLLSRKIAVDYMVRNGYSQDDIRLMRNHLGEEGWLEDESVCPEGWRVKIFEEKKGLKYNFLSPSNEHFKSPGLLLDHMLSSKESFTDLDVKKIKSVLTQRSDLDMKERESSKITTELVFNEQRHAMMMRENKSDVNSDVTNEASSNIGDLPSGWKTKQIGGQQMFISPMGEIFRTVEEVVEEMSRIGTYSSLDFESLIGVSLDPKENSFNLQPQFSSEGQSVKRPQPEANPDENLAKKIRKNSTFTQEQLMVLERCFLQAVKPSVKTIETLVEQFGVKREYILKWFAKKRNSIARPHSRGENPETQLDNKNDYASFEILEDLYKVAPVLDERQLDDLAFATGLDKTKIDAWFREKNAKNMKNETREETLKRSESIQEDQIEILEDAYIVAQCPTGEQFDELVFATGLDEAVIKNWFAKKREQSSKSQATPKPNSKHDSTESVKNSPLQPEEPLKNILPEQLEILEDAFKVAAFPSDEQFDELVFATDLSEEVVQKWFLNQQSLHKMPNKETGGARIPSIDTPGVSSYSSGETENNSRKRKISESEEKEIPKTNINEGKTNKLTAEQLEILEDAYKVAPVPTSDQYGELVYATEVDDATIKEWFENKTRMLNQERFAYQNGNINYELTDEQLKFLGEVFAKNPNPSHTIKEQLAKKIGVDKTKIIQWFNSKKSQEKIKKSSKKARY